MKFIFDDETELIKNLSYNSFPKELQDNGTWQYFAFIEDKESNIKMMCSVYNSENHKSGEIIISNKIYNEFPIAQSAWTMNDQINRMYVDPFFRNKKIAKYSVITNDIVSSYLGFQTWMYFGGNSPAGQQLLNSIYNIGIEKTKYIYEPESFAFRNYSHPVIYFDKRAVEDEADL